MSNNKLVNVRTYEFTENTHIVIDITDPEYTKAQIDNIQRAVEKWAGSNVPVLVKPFGTEIVIEYRNNLLK